MSASGIARRIALLAALAAMAGCVSVPGKNGVTVKTVEGAYVAPSSASVPSDIKQILAQGGLNVENPSAATPGTKATQLASGSRSASVDRLVAQLRNDPPGTASVEIASAAADPSGKMSLVQAEPKTPAAEAVALSAAARPESSTFVYPEIGAPADAVPVVAAAMAPAAKPHRKATQRSVTPPSGQSPKKPRRF